MSARLTTDGSAAFEDRLRTNLQAIAADVRDCLGDQLVALVLGGGYGRGEGAVIRDQHGQEQPYNDLDLTLVVHNPRQIPRGGLAEVKRRHEEVLGIEVDFSAPQSLAMVNSWKSRMMWRDLVDGHVVLWGDPQLLRRHASGASRQPLPCAEARRLLLNRGAGFLWAQRVVAGLDVAPDSDFVRRNVYKLELALGDAILIAHRAYQTQYRGREVRLAEIERVSPGVAALDLLPRYREALRFKLRPLEASRTIGADHWSTIVGSTAAVLRHCHAGALFNPSRPHEWLVRGLPTMLRAAQGRKPGWQLSSQRFLNAWRAIT